MTHTTQTAEEFEDISPDDYKNFYHCTDIEIAATLVSKGFQLASINKTSETKATFIFRKEVNIEAVVDAFWSNKVEVYPLDFANARKNLKSRIYAMKYFRR
jgi:hypothetical protein